MCRESPGTSALYYYKTEKEIIKYQKKVDNSVDRVDKTAK